MVVKKYEEIKAKNSSNFMKTYRSQKLNEPWTVDHKENHDKKHHNYMMTTSDKQKNLKSGQRIRRYIIYREIKKRTAVNLFKTMQALSQ